MALITKLDVHERALEILLSRYKASDENPIQGEKLREVLRIFCEKMQEVEDDAIDCIYERLLSDAEGVWLDQIGKIVGRTRGDLSDITYRAVLTSWIASARASGSAKDIASVLGTLLSGYDPEIHIIVAGPATYQIDIDTSGPIDADFTAATVEVVEVARPAGVTGIIVNGKKGSALRFDDSDRGFDGGGFFSSIIGS